MLTLPGAEADAILAAAYTMTTSQFVNTMCILPFAQIGKSGASWITQAFLLGTGSIAAAMPFTGVIFAGVCLVWIQVHQ